MPSEARFFGGKAHTSRPNHKTAPGPGADLFSFLSFLLSGSPRDLLGFYFSFFLFGSRDLLKFYTDAARQYGDIVFFQAGPWSIHLVNHPDYIQHILQDNNHNYRKDTFFDLVNRLIGQGLLTSEGELWRHQRRLAQPAFHWQRVAAFATIMTDATVSMLDRWRSRLASGQPLNLASEMTRLTLEVIGKTLFSTDISNEADEVGRAITTALEHFNYRATNPFTFPEYIPTPQNLRFWQAVRTLDKAIYNIIDKRRRRRADTEDLLSMLLLAHDEKMEGIGNKQLRDEVVTFVAAGHETTANALAWTWYLLSKHRQVERKLRAELTEVLGGHIPTAEDLPHLRYTRMVIQEAMRLYPPLWAIPRNTIGEDEIGGYHIPANSIVVFSPYVMHRHPAFWENPEEFDPERFTPERSTGRPRYAYFPFGGGPRRCIGREFAMMEAQLIVATVAQKYRLHLVPGHPVEPDPFFTLRPRNGVLMTLHKA